jgi:NADPH-dependent 2,4-dienoyl-CoA reductase/sulfur reductase-like enzyme
VTERAGGRVVIVGAVAAGSKAAATARRRDPALEVVVLQDEVDIAYSACGLPYHLAEPEAIPRGRLVARTPERFRADGIDLRVRQRAEAIDLDARSVAVVDLETGRSYAEPYDRLLIATGAEPIRPDLPAGPGAPPVVTLRSLADLDRAAPLVATARDAVIAGCGYVGLEAIETFRHLGARVTVVEKMARMLPAFDEESVALVLAELADHEVDVVLGEGLASVGDGAVMTDGGRRIAADLVVAAVGVRPNARLARDAGLPLGAMGAIAVDDRMETAVHGVFAAGDCAETTNRVSGAKTWLPLGDVANRQGRVAGENLAGGDRRFPGVLGTAIFRVFSLTVARTGLTADDARRAGFDAVACRIDAPSRARYMPGSVPVGIGLVADRPTGRLLGATVVGRDGADKAVDTIAAAVWGGLTLDDLADLDLAYAPPFSPVFAPVQVAAEVLRGTLREVVGQPR